MTRSPLNAWPWLVTALQAGYFAALAYLTLAISNLCCHGDAWRLRERACSWRSLA
jgi:hypothetical protein